jgi:DNA-binding MarR family transcriptional regulator
VDPAILRQGVDTLVAAGMVERVVRDGSHSVVVTPAGEEAIEKLTIARRQSLTEVLEGWDPEDHPEVVEMIRHLAEALLADDNRLLADAHPTATV